MPGCCADRSCTSDSCMRLPAGTRCSDCAFFRRCVALFGCRPEATTCDFFPRRFAEQPKPQ